METAVAKRFLQKICRYVKNNKQRMMLVDRREYIVLYKVLVMSGWSAAVRTHT